MTKVCLKMMPELLSPNKRECEWTFMLTSFKILKMTLNFLKNIITCDESCFFFNVILKVSTNPSTWRDLVCRGKWNCGRACPNSKQPWLFFSFFITEGLLMWIGCGKGKSSEHKLSEEHCFQQWKVHMEPWRDWGGECIDGSTFPLCNLLNKKIFSVTLVF